MFKYFLFENINDQKSSIRRAANQFMTDIQKGQGAMHNNQGKSVNYEVLGTFLSNSLDI